MPNYLSPDAKSLITAMLAVDPVKRITIPEITQHPFFTNDLPRYLTPLPPPPGPVLGTLSSLVSPPKQLDFEIIEGLGRIEDDVVEELAASIIGVDKDDVWECLRRDDGVQGNAVKVAYMLLRDKRRLGKDLAEFAEAERDAQLAAMDPRNTVSPAVLSPVGAMDLEENPFEVEFNAEYDDEEGEEDSDELDFISPPLPPVDDPTTNAAAAAVAVARGGAGAGPQFAVLNSSLPDQLPEQHHLTSYVSAKRSGRDREKKQHKTKWHFGIRSRSPPMEVMLEIYRTLKILGMEWKEKKNLGGLGGLKKPKSGKGGGGGAQLERNRDLDGDGGVDLKAASSIYFVETRARVQDVVVRPLFSLFYLHINFFISGPDEPPTLHGRLDQLPCRFPPQKVVQGVYGSRCGEIRHGRLRPRPLLRDEQRVGALCQGERWEWGEGGRGGVAVCVHGCGVSVDFGVGGWE